MFAKDEVGGPLAVVYLLQQCQQLAQKVDEPFWLEQQAACKLTGLWEGTKEEEKALQEQFNEGMLKEGDVHNEFYPIEEWPKIYRDLMTHHKEMPLQIDYPPASGHAKARKKCCGGREYFCQCCPKTFDKASNWVRHVK